MVRCCWIQQPQALQCHWSMSEIHLAGRRSHSPESKVHIKTMFLAPTWLVTAALKRPSALPCFGSTEASLACARLGLDLARRLDDCRGTEPQAHWQACPKSLHMGSGAYMMAFVKYSHAHMGHDIVPIARGGCTEDAAVLTHNCNSETSSSTSGDVEATPHSCRLAICAVHESQHHMESHGQIMQTKQGHLSAH